MKVKNFIKLLKKVDQEKEITVESWSEFGGFLDKVKKVTIEYGLVVIKSGKEVLDIIKEDYKERRIGSSMEVSFKLKNYKRCNGCPLISKEEVMSPSNHLATVCELGYWTKKVKNQSCPSYVKNLYTTVSLTTGKPYTEEEILYDSCYYNSKTYINRPKKCINRHGK